MKDDGEKVKNKPLYLFGNIFAGIGALVVLMSSFNFIYEIFIDGDFFQKMSDMNDFAHILIYCLLGSIIFFFGFAMINISVDVESFFKKEIPSQGNLTEYKHNLLWFALSLGTSLMVYSYLFLGEYEMGEFTVPLFQFTTLVSILYFSVISYYKKIVESHKEETI